MLCQAVIIVVFFVDMFTALSTCSSHIIMNGASYSFHVEDAKDLRYEAIKFCNKNHVVAEECERIISHHIQKCFSTDGASSPISAEIDNCDPARAECNANRDTLNDAADDLRVDYSTKVGPVLTVTLESSTKVLQAYAGEQPAQAVHRFCRMHELNDFQCDQVRKKYYELCAIAADNTAPHPNSNSSPDTSETHTTDRISQLALSLKVYIEQYWQWIALIIILAYVMIENQ